MSEIFLSVSLFRLSLERQSSVFVPVEQKSGFAEMPTSLVVTAEEVASHEESFLSTEAWTPFGSVKRSALPSPTPTSFVKDLIIPTPIDLVLGFFASCTSDSLL